MNRLTPLMASVLIACAKPAHDVATDAPPTVDATSDCNSACENLRSPAVGCPEGIGAIGGESCEAVCERSSNLRALPLKCWMTAKSAADARGCGSLRCVKP